MYHITLPWTDKTFKWNCIEKKRTPYIFLIPLLIIHQSNNFSSLAVRGNA